MHNLVGGGIDDGETPQEAQYREGDEEIHELSSHITTPVKVCEIEGPITPKNGPPMRARWILSRAKLLVPPSELRIATNSEITAITALTDEECFAHPNMSDLARLAIWRDSQPWQHQDAAATELLVSAQS